MESHMPRKLDTEMPKAADALHGDQVAAAQASIAQSVIGRHSRAEERGSVNGTEFVGNGSDRACLRDHHFRISSVLVYSQNHGVLAIHDVPAPARYAHAVFTGNESDTHALANFPPRHSAAQRVDAANNLMPGNARQSQTGVNSHDRGRVGVTDSACFHPDANLSGTCLHK